MKSILQSSSFFSLSLFRSFVFFFWLQFPTIFHLISRAAAKLEWLRNVAENTYGSRNFAGRARLNDAEHSRRQCRGGASRWPSYSRTLNRRRERSFLSALRKTCHRIFRRFISGFNDVNSRLGFLPGAKKIPKSFCEYIAIYLVKYCDY